jgi:hypothetical protein
MADPPQDYSAVARSAILNASLGVGLSLHDEGHLSGVLKEVIKHSPVTWEEFIARLEDVCHGEFKVLTSPPFRKRGGSPHLFKSVTPSDCVRSGYVSQVVRWSAFASCLSDSEFDRIFSGSTVLRNGHSDPTDGIWASLMSMDRVARSRRKFRIAPESWWRSKPVHWWTPRAPIENILKKLAPEKWADTIRDKLGLYFPHYQSDGTAEAKVTNRRFLLHVPAALLIRSGHFRPNFADAGGYCRFAAHRSLRAPPSVEPWGKTADMGVLAAQGRLASGLKERVTGALSDSDVNDFAVEFDYIGEVTTARGATGSDDDAAFERTLRKVHSKAFPGDASRLTRMEGLLPTMTP